MRQGSLQGKYGRLLLSCALFLALTSCGGSGEEAASSPVSQEGCAACHSIPTTAWRNDSSHKLIYKECTFCHEEAKPTPGDEHRVSPWCDNCHSEEKHPPERLGADEESKRLLFITCMTCHYPMGSTNQYLIREEILVDPGELSSVDLHNLEGRADDSYAELGPEEGGENNREPGSGVCEVCHTRTRFYNQSGTGEGHYRVRCSRCHDHAHAFRVDASCLFCHTPAVNNIFHSLHTTRQGMETWYSAQNGGFELLTGVPYDDLGCKECHRADQPGWKEPNCKDCHGTNGHEVEDDVCLKCHGRQAAEINKHQLSDVHRDAGMGCTDCHVFTEIHGDGEKYDSMFAPGAMEARCENCHDSLSENEYHTLHLETVDCSTCHTQTVLSCYNCHFDSEVLGKGKFAYGQFKDWKFLLNRNGKVHPGTIQTLKYGSIEQGDDATFVVIAPYYSHSVEMNAVVCEDCHGSQAVNEYRATGEIKVVQWNGETESLEQATGIIPVPPDYETALKFHYVDWDGEALDEFGKPVWTLFKTETDAFQMIRKYGSPLTEGQIQKLEHAFTSDSR